MSPTTPPDWVDLSCTVSQFVTHAPAALPILSSLGIDTCCGGTLPLAEAARRHGVAQDLLVERLRPALVSAS